MDLKPILDRFAGRRVLVVGDVMLDEYVWGQVSRISPEAPVMVVDAERYSQVPGGAANVVNNLCALSATGTVSGLIGGDEAGRTLSAALQAEGAETNGLIIADDRPTTRKTRIVAHSQQVVRVDHEKRQPLSDTHVQNMKTMLEELIPGSDAVILSDYQKGVLGPEIVRCCVQNAKLYDKPITGNLKPVMLDEDCQLTVITLNLLEASQAIGLQRPMETEEQILDAGVKILAKTKADNVLITRGSKGLSLFSKEKPTEPVYVPAHQVEVYDVAGAGDTVISTMTLALAAGATPHEAVVLANYAAAEVVKKLGVATITVPEIAAAIARDMAAQTASAAA